MKITRWDPVRDLESLSNRLNQVFGQSAARPDEAPVFADWTPLMDVEETEAEYLVKTDLPDIKKEDVKVAIQDGVLSLEGDVELRPANAPTQSYLKAEALEVDTARNVAYSKRSPVTVRFGQHSMQVQSFEADLKSEKIQARSVNGRFEGQ